MTAELDYIRLKHWPWTVRYSIRDGDGHEVGGFAYSYPEGQGPLAVIIPWRYPPITVEKSDEIT